MTIKNKLALKSVIDLGAKPYSQVTPDNNYDETDNRSGLDEQPKQHRDSSILDKNSNPRISNSFITISNSNSNIHGTEESFIFESSAKNRFDKSFYSEIENYESSKINQISQLADGSRNDIESENHIEKEITNRKMKSKELTEKARSSGFSQRQVSNISKNKEATEIYDSTQSFGLIGLTTDDNLSMNLKPFKNNDNNSRCNEEEFDFCFSDKNDVKSSKSDEYDFGSSVQIDDKSSKSDEFEFESTGSIDKIEIKQQKKEEVVIQQSEKIVDLQPKFCKKLLQFKHREIFEGSFEREEIAVVPDNKAFKDIQAHDNKEHLNSENSKNCLLPNNT